MDQPPQIQGERFGDWLGQQIAARGISQRALAHRSGVNHSTISRLLRHGRTPSLETAGRLAGALGVVLPAFISGVRAPRVEILRQTLLELGLDPREVEAILASHRRRQGRTDNEERA